MKNTIYEKSGSGYTQVGNYRLPNLIPGSEEHNVGPWGQRHLRWLKKHRRVTYTNLLTTGKLPGYLADIDREAQEMFSLLVEQYAAAEGVTEKLKADDQMAWVGRMNNIRERVEEVVLRELVYC
jgi:hypothetical protein